MGCCTSISARREVAKYPADYLKGKVAIVTGPNTGIGKVTAASLAALGCHVVMAGRNMERLEAAARDIRNEASTPVDLRCLLLNLASLESVLGFARQFQALGLPLHFLVNNAGIMGNDAHGLTVDGFEQQWATNHLAHFYLTELLLPLMKRSDEARIINVSSNAHMFASFPNAAADFSLASFSVAKESYSPFRSYGISKMSNIWSARTLSHRLEGSHVLAVSLHPGAISTELGRNSGVAAIFYQLAGSLLRTVDQGAATTMYCALTPQLDAGRYYDTCALGAPNSTALELTKAEALERISYAALRDKGFPLEL